MRALQTSDRHAGSTGPTAERRRHQRLPVTLTARLRHSGRWYRTEIFDVSDGGLLLAPIAGLDILDQDMIEIEAATIERVQARIVAVSENGIHVRVEAAPAAYHSAVERLFELTRAVAKRSSG